MDLPAPLEHEGDAVNMHHLHDSDNIPLAGTVGYAFYSVIIMACWF